MTIALLSDCRKHYFASVVWGR